MRSLLFGFLLLSGCMHAEGFVDPEEDRMIKIEQNVTLPSRADLMRKYRRYYAWSLDDPAIVDAVYVRGGKPGRFWLTDQNLPIVLHGGCHVVTFEYDTRLNRATNVACN